MFVEFRVNFKIAYSFGTIQNLSTTVIMHITCIQILLLSYAQLKLKYSCQQNP